MKKVRASGSTLVSLEGRGFALSSLSNKTENLAVQSQNFKTNAQLLTKQLTAKTTWIDRIYNQLGEIFLDVYAFDSYILLKHSVETKDGPKRFEVDDLSEALIAASLLGLPSRPDSQNKLTLKQLLRNFIGGWKPINRDSLGNAIWTEKHRWQILAIPFKFLIILPIKLILLPFKLLLNVAKLFTEFLPTMLLSFTTFANLELINLIVSSDDNPKLGRGKIPAVIGLVILLILNYLLMIAAGLLKFLAEMLTSPLKSIQRAYQFDITEVKPFQDLGRDSWISKIIRGLTVFISALAALVMWVVFFPVMISAVVSYVPFIAQAITWIGQLPVIAQITTFIQPLLMQFSSVISFMFNTSLSVSIGTALGLQVSSAMVAIGSTLGFFANLIGIGLSYVGDKLSNSWVLKGWESKTGPLSTLASLSFNPEPTDQQSSPGHDFSSDDDFTETPSEQSRQKARRMEESLVQASAASESSGKNLVSGTYTSVSEPTESVLSEKNRFVPGFNPLASDE